MADPQFQIAELQLEIEGEPLSMAHVRTQIRQAAVSALAGLPTTGSNIFDSRPEARNWPGEDLPGLNVLTPTDILNGKIPQTRGIDSRQIFLVVEVRAFDAATADQAAAEVEAALAEDPTLGGKAKGLFLNETQSRFRGELNKAIAFERLEFAVDYRIAPTDPETSLP